MIAGLLGMVVDLFVFFERVPEDEMHPDVAVTQLEAIAAALHQLEPNDRRDFLAYLATRAHDETDEDERDLLLQMPEYVGLVAPQLSSSRPGWFDPHPPSAIVDRKVVVISSPRGVDQAARQDDALRQNGMKGRWEVPTPEQAVRAERVLNQAGATEISVRVVDR